MSDNWKREQNIVLELENDVKFKEEQLVKAYDANHMQKNMIDLLNADLTFCKNKMTNMTPRGNARKFTPTAKDSEKNLTFP